MATEPKPKGSMTCRQAGRRGGRATARKHGPEHYQRLGRMGQERSQTLLAKGRAAEAQEQEQGS